jgi:hypothetical protein
MSDIVRGAAAHAQAQAQAQTQSAKVTADEAARIAIQGRGLAIHLCVLMKTARLHDVGNIAFQGPLVNFIDTVELMWTAEGDFKMQAVGDFLYVNQYRLRVDASSYPSYQYLIDEF